MERESKQQLFAFWVIVAIAVAAIISELLIVLA